MIVIKSLGLFAATLIIFVSYLVYAMTDNPQKNEIMSHANDATIAMSIKGDLFMDPSLSTTKASVTSEGGVVTLRGEADSPATRDRIEDLARKEHGVLSVHNYLTVR